MYGYYVMVTVDGPPIEANMIPADGNKPHEASAALIPILIETMRNYDDDGLMMMTVIMTMLMIMKMIAGKGERKVTTNNNNQQK